LVFGLWFLVFGFWFLVFGFGVLGFWGFGVLGFWGFEFSVFLSPVSPLSPVWFFSKKKILRSSVSPCFAGC
jgi:hypothetical protein